MGLSASQARFLQLTARKSNVEYEVQQISFERLQIANKVSAASTKYQDAVNNRHLVFTYNTGSGKIDVDLSYKNYKNYMNLQMDDLQNSTQQKYFLVSSTGNQIVVANEKERDEILELNTQETSLASIEAAKKVVDAYKAYLEEKANPSKDTETTETTGAETTDEATTDTETTDTTTDEEKAPPIPTAEEYRLANIDVDQYTIKTKTDDNGNEVEYIEECPFGKDDFFIAQDHGIDLNNPEYFQRAIKDGTFFFATKGKNSETGEDELKTIGWDVLGAGAITDELDKTDDAAAEAEYKATTDRLQAIDKKLELRIDQLETERNAIQTEMDSVQKTVQDNVERSFGVFG